MIFIILITDVIKSWEQIKAGHDKKKFFKFSESYRPQPSYSHLYNVKPDYTAGPTHTTYAQAVAIKMNIYCKINCQIIEPWLHDMLWCVVFFWESSFMWVQCSMTILLGIAAPAGNETTLIETTSCSITWLSLADLGMVIRLPEPSMDCLYCKRERNPGKKRSQGRVIKEQQRRHRNTSLPMGHKAQL